MQNPKTLFIAEHAARYPSLAKGASITVSVSLSLPICYVYTNVFAGQ